MVDGFQFLREAPQRASRDTRPDLSPLASALCEAPVEVRIGPRGATQAGVSLPVSRDASLALLRRNIHSLIARRAERAPVEAALEAAVAASAARTERAFHEAGVLYNLGESLFVDPGATVRFEGEALVIEDRSGELVNLDQRQLEAGGERFFCREALERILRLDVSAVRLSPAAISPRHLQVPVGAVMLPGTAGVLKKGSWRGDLLPDFLKEFCINCARCYVYCPDGAILHSEILKERAGETGVLGIDFERCTGCGTCETVCPATREGYRAMVMVRRQEPATRESHHVSAKR